MLGIPICGITHVEIGELSMAMKCIASISGMALGYHEDILGKIWNIIGILYCPNGNTWILIIYNT
jgi:hypothetical protein